MKVLYGATSICKSNTDSSLPYSALRLAVAAGLLVSVLVSGQEQPKTLSVLNDAQALALMQSVAKGAGSNSPALAAAQMQLLSQYLQQQSALTGSADGGQAQVAARMVAVQSSSSAPVAVTRTTSITSGLESASAPKKPGAIRIGVAQPKAQMGQGNSGANVSDPLRLTLIRYLSGPAFEVVPVNAMLSSQIDAEAAQKECDYVLYTAMTQKMSGGGAGLLRKAMPMMSMIPIMGPLGGMAGAVAGSAAGVAMSGAAGLSSTVKAKSEVSLDYKLTAVGNAAPVVANSVKAKAKQDGEDIVSPLIEQAALAIIAELSKKR